METNDNKKLKIYTLGHFKVCRGENNLSETTNRSYRLWELFKYLITNRNRVVLPETVMEQLWPEEDYADPKGALRALVYRIRQILEPKRDSQDNSFILFSHGGYSWNKDQDYWLDAEEFELLIKKARGAVTDSLEESIEYYKKVIDLYKGEYLPECYYSQWVIPVRNFYQNQYLEAVQELVKILGNLGRYEEVIVTCQQALNLHPFEEEIHLAYIDALLEVGKTKQAQVHYQYANQQLYRELGVKPSPAMLRIGRIIQNSGEKLSTDLSTIQDNLGADNIEGAFVCDADIFRYIYKLERRRRERSGQALLLILLTLSKLDFTLPQAELLTKVRPGMEKLLINSLRKGDVIAHWNDTQFLLLLPGLNYEQGEKVIERIKQNFAADVKYKDLLLRSEIQPMLPLEEYMAE